MGTLEISVAPSAGIAGFLGFVLFIYLFFKLSWAVSVRGTA